MFLKNFWIFKNYAVFKGNKCFPVFPFWILLWSLFTFFAIASKILSARTLDVPRLKYLRNCISCFNSPKEPSTWILRLVLRWIPSSDRIRSKSSLRYFKNVLLPRAPYDALPLVFYSYSLWYSLFCMGSLCIHCIDRLFSH